MHILVTGSNGQLGQELQKIAGKYPDFSFVFTDIEELDICKADNIKTFFADKEFDVIINCAAYTNVDKCETDKKSARDLNTMAVKELANICVQCDCKLIHISTDYVYDGKNHVPYTETDFTNPMSYYGQTKLDGEKMVEEYADTAVIIRTSWLYSSFGNNFVKTIIKHASQKESLNVVFDQIGTPTYAGDLAKVILDNLDNINYMNGVHIFNFSNEGVSSWYDFAKEIVDLMHIDCKINPITTKEYPLPAPRPAYSILNKAKIKEELNIAIPHWKDSLKVCIKELKAKL